MSDKGIKEGDFCYIKVGPKSPQSHLNNMVVKVTKKSELANAVERAQGRAWEVEPHLYTKDKKRVYTAWYEWALQPLIRTTVQDVVDTLEVLAMGNKATFGVLQEFAAKAKEDKKKEDKP